METFLKRRNLLAGAAALALLTTLGTTAQAADPAVARIQTYYAQLLPTIQQAGALGVRERAQRFRKPILTAFDIGTMARVASGPAWSRFSASQQAAVRSAFGEFLVADYASQINNYSGQSFQVDPNVESRGGRRIVKSQILQNGSPVQINYAMSGNRIIDVYFNGSISDLATRREEFQSILSSGGGVEALISGLRKKAQALLGG